jgi:ABC-type oligopeptide transport system substrate-binding subunit
MKKLLLLAFICVAGFYACKKSEPNSEPTNSTKIIGKWAHFKSTYVKTTKGVDSILEVQNLSDSLYLQFNADGTGILSQNGSNTNYKYTLSGDALTLAANDSLNITFKLRTLTLTDMTLRFQDEEEGDVSYSTDRYFTKQ